MKPLIYPVTHKGLTVDTYFGTEVADPYRWLEDDLSEETAAWVQAENNLTFDYLDKIPFRSELKQRLETLWNYEKIGAPFNEGDYTYFYKNDGLQNQYVLYRHKEGAEATVFLDPNTFSEDGTISLGNVSFSDDGSLVAYSISEGGADWRKIIVMDTRTKKVQKDTIRDVKFSGLSWKGNEGFFYSSYKKPQGSELSAKTDQHRLFYHKLGTPQKEDVLVFGETQKRRYVSGSVTEDGRYLIISAAISTSGNELYYQDLMVPNGQIKPIILGFEYDSAVLDHQNGRFIIITNKNAPNKRIVWAPVQNPGLSQWTDLIPESPHVLSPSKAGGYIFAHYMVDAI
ncbi:MAG: S9 family peptidase, partial [Lutibacter sp.]|nr:S9 family peptidase [Lutibacter sp.]